MFFIGKIKRDRRFRIVSTGAFLFLMILTLLAVFPIVRHEESAEAAYIPSTSTLAIVSNKDTASVDVAPASNNGTFVISDVSNQAEFTVTTDNLTGYSVTILGTDNSGQLVNATTGDTLDTISSDVSENDFRNGAAATYSNKWGYRLKVNGTITTDFMAAPTTSTAKSIYSTAASNAPGTSDDYTLSLGARVDYTKPSGTYTNTFILAAVGNPISYRINYLDNSSGTDTPALPADAESNITASSVILSTSIPTRSGYDFKGWCYGTVSHATTSSTCTGTTYQPGDLFSFSTISSGVAIADLYAMWEMPPEIQNLDFSLCTTTPRKVVDARDGKEYKVAKLADGNCWMVSDLNLAGGTVLNADTSDVPTDGYYTLPASPAILSSTDFSDDTKDYVYNTGVESTDQADCNNSPGCNSYYSWLAATAGGKDASGAAVTGDGYNAAYSICPKGWRLPAATTSDAPYNTDFNWKTGDFYRLAVAYGASLETQYYESTTTFYDNAGPNTIPNFLLAGNYEDGALTNAGSRGRYWSSTSRTSTNANNFNFYATAVYSGANSSRKSGQPVRCVRKNLYDTIAEMSKGTQIAADLQAAITVPTSANRALDTSNSGVYEYNASVFGTATDAANTYKIYYYRGVLENTVGTYGSDGSAVTYPNYVKLGNTCWRIVRTTGSGGVKMIYNGNWTGSTCANATDNAQLGVTTFSVDSDKYYGSAFGYTQNSAYNSSPLSATYGTMFGTNTNFSVNSTDSGIKTYIEDWYSNTSGIKATYNSHLEADAGYCADRTLNESHTWTTPMADSDTVASGGMVGYYAGAAVRIEAGNPSLTCPRNNADVYTTSAATTGNKQLDEPIALITADEADFAGSGFPYHANSFLNSGESLGNSWGFWLLSPLGLFEDQSSPSAVSSDGNISGGWAGFDGYGVRPAISLSHGTKIATGTGIATDPWEVAW